MTNKLTHIGSTEHVALLVGKGYDDILAKVDTGADFSSIWASNVSEEDGTLSFSLFGPGSKHYSGEVITTTDYGVALVKNSFGDTEQRYKARLSIKVAGRRVKVEFRLADRSRNRFPVLIGKTTLRNRFLVDVATTKRQPSVRRVLVLNSLPSKHQEEFFKQVNAVSPKLQCDFRTYDDFAIVMDANGLQVIDLTTKSIIDDYDLIYFKTHAKRAEFASSIAEYAQSRNKMFLDKEVASYQSHSKISQYARLSRMGISIPKTIAVAPSKLVDQFEWFESELGLPFIFKDAEADRGLNNYLVESAKQFKKLALRAEKQRGLYVAQQFIENDGDFRFIVMLRDVEMVFGRRGVQDSHLNNTSMGGKAVMQDLSEVPSGLKSLAVRAAMAMQRDIAGVDLIQDRETGSWFILEVNNGPQLARGAFLDEKVHALAKFLRKYTER